MSQAKDKLAPTYYRCNVNFFGYSEPYGGYYSVKGSHPILFDLNNTSYTTPFPPGNATFFALDEGNKTGIVVAYRGFADKPRKNPRKTKDWIEITLYRREVETQIFDDNGRTIIISGVKKESELGSLNVKGNGAAEKILGVYRIRLECYRPADIKSLARQQFPRVEVEY